MATALPAYLDPNSPISQQRSVYFPFDNASYRPQDKSVVSCKPDTWRSIRTCTSPSAATPTSAAAAIQPALGERRAQTVKSALTLLGVKDAQVEAVSYGKEKPKATGHDEAAWQQNRRADFVYPTMSDECVSTGVWCAGRFRERWVHLSFGRLQGASAFLCRRSRALPTANG